MPGAACARIQNSNERLGVRESHKVQPLAEATETMEGAESKMRELIRLLARCPKVELGKIAAQFGPVIEPSRLTQMKQDLQDLETLLGKE